MFRNETYNIFEPRKVTLHKFKIQFNFMKKNLLTLCAIALMISTSLLAQNQKRCGTMEYLAAQKAADPTLAARMADVERQTQQWITSHPNYRTTSIITIPVVFHVVYSTSAQNISDAQCQYQLAQLNADYARLNSDAGNTPSVWQSIAANTQVQFCLAVRDPNGNATSGVVHKSTTVASFSDNDNVKHNSSGGDDAWPSASYLNIWSCNLGGGLLGYAQFPGGSASTDGVVFLYSSIGSIAHPGTAAPYNFGRTATHEIGHWLNLFHIWGDDGTSCSGTDNCSDTPNQADENYGCPAFPNVSCSNGPNGDMFMNYMDYTDDGCMNMFTAGQASRMQATLAGSRASIQSSLGCVAPSGCGVPGGLSASSITSTSATLNWTSVSGFVSYNVQYRIVGAGSWTSTTSTTNSKAISGLTAASNYEFQVQTVCSSTSSAFSGSGTFTTSGTGTCGVPSGLSASSVTSSSATLNWTTVSGFVSYNVQYRIVGAGSWTSTTSTTNSKAISGLTASANYEFQVQTVCSGSSSAFSGSGTFTTSAASSCTTSYEPNNTSSAALTIPVNTDITSVISSSSDIDWYKFVNTSSAPYIKVTLTTLPFDYDVVLYNSALSQIGISQNGGTTSETIKYNSTTVNTRYIKVYGYNGAFSTTSCYTLRASISGTPWRVIGDNEVVLEDLQPNTFSMYPNPAQTSLNINFQSSASSNVSVQITDILGKVVMNNSFTADEGYNSYKMNVENLNKGIYIVVVENNKSRTTQRLVIAR